MEIELESVKVVATFLEEQAPKTCKAMSEALPLDAEAKHSTWSGNAIWFVSDKLPVVEPENAFCLMSQGDVVIYPGIKEVMVIYGRRAFSRGPSTDNSPANVFAVVRDLDAMDRFAEKARNLVNVGAKRICLRKM